MTHEALNKGKVEIFLEKTLNRDFLKVYLLGTLTGCILSLAAYRSSVLLMLAGLLFGLGVILVIFKS